MNLSSPRTRETTFEPYHRRKGGASPAQLTAFPVYISRRVLGQCFATAKGRGGSMPGNREKSKCFVWLWRKNREASHSSVRRASVTWQGLSLSSSSLFYICVVQKVSAATCGGLASLCVEYCCEMFVERQIPIMGGKDTHTHTRARARALVLHGHDIWAQSWNSSLVQEKTNTRKTSACDDTQQVTRVDAQALV